MKRLSLLLAIVMTSALVSTTSLQGASKDFPDENLCAGPPIENVPSTGGGEMRLIVKYKPAGPNQPTLQLDTSADAVPISLASCVVGAEVTRAGAFDLCHACEIL